MGDGIPQSQRVTGLLNSLENLSFDLLLEEIDALKYPLTDPKPAAEIANRAQAESTYNAFQLRDLISRLEINAK